MNLRRYKELTGYTFRELGRKWDIDPAQLARYSNPKPGKLPSLTTAYRIYKKTGHKVCLEDWFKKETGKEKL